MTDSITHVSGREREREKAPTDVIPLRAGDLCPRSSLRVSEAACTLVEYVNAASVPCECERGEEEETAQIRGG